jgi:hypothetical protein
MDCNWSIFVWYDTESDQLFESIFNVGDVEDTSRIFNKTHIGMYSDHEIIKSIYLGEL